MNPTHILVPVDFGSGSDRAVHYALSIARKHAARVTLLHTVQLAIADERFGIPRTELLARLQAEAHDRFGKFAATGVTIEKRVMEGPPARCILEQSALLIVDLIVMAVKPRNFWQRLFGRATCETVTRLATCPVWLVRSARAAGGLRDHAAAASEVEDVLLLNPPAHAL